MPPGKSVKPYLCVKLLRTFIFIAFKMLAAQKAKAQEPRLISEQAYASLCW